jgi:hypothetical protein
MTTNIIKSSIITTLLASLALLSGCAVDAQDDSAETAITEEAQAFGGPGFPVPRAGKVEPGDSVERQLSKCVVPSEATAKRLGAYKCMKDAARECSLDGGTSLGFQQGETCWAGEATCTIYTSTSCLFKADAS